VGLIVLIGNYNVLSKHPGRSLGGGAQGEGMNRGESNKSSMARGAFTNAAWQAKSGVPDGYRAPYAWVLPKKAGGLSARNNLSGAGALSLTMARGLNGAAGLTGAGSLSGTAALIVSLVAAVTGSGTITSASAIAFLNLAANLAGAGNITASIKAIGHALAALSGSGTATSTIRATGALTADIAVTGDLLNSANVGAAVWSAIATANNEAGTMGEKLNDAGSAGNPWATVIESGMTAEEILRVVLAYVAGKTTVDETGADPVVAFRDVDDTKDRISATMDGSTRSSVTLDGA
jgi:hypothetical protein